MQLLQFIAIVYRKKKIQKLENQVNELSEQNKRIIVQNNELISVFEKKEKSKIFLTDLDN